MTEKLIQALFLPEGTYLLIRTLTDINIPALKI